MKSIFDKAARDELIKRINSLTETNEAQWGKMNINQMIRHCILWDESVLGRRELKRSVMSRLFGKIFLKSFVKDESPLKHNLPSVPELKITRDIDKDLVSEKKKWIALIDEYQRISNNKFILPFFGKVKKEEAGLVAYKHSYHHLRQFNS
jgi:hypothetical protein